MSHGGKKQTQVAKSTKKPAVPYPNLITQVSKDEEKKNKVLEFFNVNRCCSLFLRCFASKKENFTPLVDAAIPSLLGPKAPEFKGKKTLVLDLDETLVHSTFEPVKNPDLVLPVRIQGMTYRINVIKRPGVEEFLARASELFEVVIFTASLAEYAEPLVRILDETNTISSLLYRQHCTLLNGVYVKDMSLIGRDLRDIILVDNSPNSFFLQPENAYHIKNFFDDKTDTELYRLTAFLEKIMNVEDVRPIEGFRQRFENKHPNKIKKFVKVNQDSDYEASSRQANKGMLPSAKKKEELEKSNNIETEPDLRNDKDGKLQSFRMKVPEKNKDKEKQYENYYSKAVPLTERVVNDRLLDESLDSNFYDLELPSPKESDMLIHHNNQAADSGAESEDKSKSNKSRVPPLSKAASAIFKNLNNGLVTVKDPTLDGQVEEVRYHTGIDNLNSPLGMHVKIELPDVGS
jgi:RNA polymerase II subunit A small phosphatase-like protein